MKPTTALCLIVATLLLTGMTGAPALPLSETFDKHRGTDLTWYVTGPPFDPGDTDAAPPVGASASWGDECLRFDMGRDMAAAIWFAEASTVSASFDLYVSSDFDLLNAGAYVHLGDLPLFVWIGNSDGRVAMLFDVDPYDAVPVPISTDAFHHVEIMADGRTGQWRGLVDGELAASGMAEGFVGRKFGGMSYAGWTWDGETGPPQVYFDNFAVEKLSAWPGSMYLPLSFG